MQSGCGFRVLDYWHSIWKRFKRTCHSELVQHDSSLINESSGAIAPELKAKPRRARQSRGGFCGLLRHFIPRNDNRVAAFTLAEVLITLTIIGVIAALTIPNLIAKYEKQEYVSKLKKTYSTFLQATNIIITENGSPKCNNGGWGCSTEEVYNLYKKHLNKAKDCGPEQGCIMQLQNNGYNKFLNGQKDITNYETESNMYNLILSDGIQCSFIQNSQQCTLTGSYSNNGSNNVCERIIIDVNGSKKPNTFGRDIFEFVIKETGLYPAGCDIPDYYCEGNGVGLGCACKVLRENAMNY